MGIGYWQVSGLQGFYDETPVGLSTSGPVGATYKSFDALWVAPDPGAAYTADFEFYDVIWIELTEACTITVDNVFHKRFSPAAVRTVKMWINTQTFAVTWAGVTAWIGGAPTLANNTTSLLEFTSPDGGTTVYGRAIADGLTEITAPLRDTRAAYAFGSTNAYKHRSITVIDTVYEITMQHPTGMMIGAEETLGATSDMIADGWISTGLLEDRGLENFSLPTGTLRHTGNLLGNYGDYQGSPNAMYGEDGGTNTTAYFTPGVSSSGTVYSSAGMFDLVTYAYSNKNVTYQFQDSSVFSDDTKGWFVNTSVSGTESVKSEILFSTAVVTTNGSFSASWNPWAIGNDQTTNGYIVGGATISEQFSHDDIRRFAFATGTIATTLLAVLPTTYSGGNAWANTLTHLYAAGYNSGSNGIKFDWATETVAANIPTGKIAVTIMGYQPAVLNEFTRN